jgi:exoribonuclease R
MAADPAEAAHAPRAPLRCAAAIPSPLSADFDALRAELKVPEAFPQDVERAAAEAAARPLALDGRTDLRDVPFVTIDPPGSMDLDQAYFGERDGDGYLVRYAIADVGFFVERGGPIEAEAWRRGATAYAPDKRAPVYPLSLSEGAASLLPDGDRPAVCFTLKLNARGVVTSMVVERAVVRSTRKMSYGEAQDEGGLSPLDEIGPLRLALEQQRNAIRLDVPGQEIVPDPSSPTGYALALETQLPIEKHNEQISLMVGIEAARVMIERGAGLLRVTAPTWKPALDEARHAARVLGVDWPGDVAVDDIVRTLHRDDPHHMALLAAIQHAMGRASYAAFTGAPPADSVHSGLGSHYAHVTAPMRRLCDRYVLDLLCDGAPPAAVGRDKALDALPAAMAKADAHNGRFEHALVDLVEARLLEHRVGDTFDAVVLSHHRDSARIQIADPPVRASLPDPAPPPGDRAKVQLRAVDARARRLDFGLSG